jgi:hypothetical protein
MEIYYIYEIPGVKVGCTKNLKSRVEQRQKCPLGQYNVLGAANNIQDASEMEQEWQIKLGYSVDKINYNKVLKWQAKRITSDYSNNTGKQMHTPEARAKVDYVARTANIDYSKIHTSEIRAKAAANTDYKARDKKLKKPILQYDKQGNFIKEWPSTKDAGVTLKLHKSGITNCCKGKLKSCGGFIWEYKN